MKRCRERWQGFRRERNQICRDSIVNKGTVGPASR